MIKNYFKTAFRNFWHNKVFSSINVNVLVTKKNSKDPVVYKNQSGVIFTNEDYFKMLSYKWIAGSSSGIQQPFTVVLTESRAKQYFPNTSFQDVIGETITYLSLIHISE